MNSSNGLSSTEARQLFDRFGANEIVGKPRQTPVQIFLSQFTSILVILLIVAALASFVLGDLLDGLFILLIVILNAILGFVQEYRAEKAIEALKRITVSLVRIVRDGQEQEIDSKLLVPGDLIILEEGDKVPADAKLVDSLHFEINEASLTGESLPIEKTVQEGKNEIYLGTIVAKGRAKALVTTTGMRTRFGKIAASLSEIAEEDTPLTKKLQRLGKQLGILAIGASTAIFILGTLKKEPLFDMILTSISLAVASVPEGLPTVITITLAVGIQRMAREKTIARKLASVETLGSVTVIATDKTGTLTKNEMHVTDIWLDGKVQTPHMASSKKTSTDMFNKLLHIASFCNTASLVFKHDHGNYDVVGDTTEGALLLMVARSGMLPDEIKQHGELLEEFAFDPTRKSMSVITRVEKDTAGFPKGTWVLTKGAPESVLSFSSKIYRNGREIPLNRNIQNEIQAAFEVFAKKGLRVIAMAYKPIAQSEVDRDDAEKDLTFLGFVGISDPPRIEVAQAISEAKAAGIRTIMITGDNELTANTIATHIGLIGENEEVITGKQFDQMTDEEVRKRLHTIRIFARTTPEHKYRIVKLLQQNGEIVAVTGDGVNDALALKQADIGVAMGITGTDVAKEAADMIITDDNYSTIVKAVEEGRTIFDNIKSSIRYLIGCNIGEVLAILGGILLGWPTVLTPLQILYVNLVTDGLPALALSLQPKNADVMREKPNLEKSIFKKRDGYWFFEVSMLTATITLFAFILGWQWNGLALARTLAFTTLILCQYVIFTEVWARNRSVFTVSRSYKNAGFLFSILIPLGLFPLLLYVPAFSAIFKVVPLSPSELMLPFFFSLLLLVVSEIRKMVQRRYRLI